MRKIRDVLRLSAEGLSTRQIAASLAIGRTTLRDYLECADELGLNWPLPPSLSDTGLERQICPRTARDVSNRATQPVWAHVHRELRRNGVTLSLLWEEHRADQTEGYGYSRFCKLYMRWEGKLSPVMRQRHPAGERLLVDYAGQTIDVIDIYKCARDICSSRRSRPRARPLRRRPGRNRCRIGSRAMCAPSAFLEG